MKEIIVVCDTETTGLLPRKGSDLALYPHMAEIYATQIDPETDKVIKEIETLIKIPVPMPEKLTKHVHGISDEMLRGQPTFIELWTDIAEVFLGADVMVAANLMFDLGVLVHELKRIDKEYQFPYPPERFCTIQNSVYITGRRLKNSVLYKMATGKELIGIHRAKADAMATYENYKWLKEQGR
jgi:DNA polymerase-3 subunit epsilon